MKDILEITVCQYCNVPDKITDLWANLREMTAIRTRWCTLLKSSVYEAILISGLSMDKFDNLYTYAVENLEQLTMEFNIDAMTFDDFAPQWGRAFATFFQESLFAYQRLYIDAMGQADNIRTVKAMGFDLEPAEQVLLTASEQRIGDVETA